MDKFDELEKLAKLKEQWILTEDEFVHEKQRVLGGWTTVAAKARETESIDRSNPECLKLPTYHDSSKDGPFAMFLSHRGRITRSQWIGRMLILLVLMVPGSIIREMNLDYSVMSLIERMPYVAGLILYFLAFYGVFAITSKRFHDFNTRGILQVIPVYGLIAPLFKSGNGVDNRYGPPREYSNVPENVRDWLSPWFAWAFIALIAVIIITTAIMAYFWTASESEPSANMGTKVMDSSESLPGGHTTANSKLSTDEWIKYNSVDYGFVAEFPSVPQEKNENTEDGRGFLTVQSKEGESTFFVYVTRFDSELDSSMIDGNLIRKLTESYGTISTFSAGRAITSEWVTTIGFTASFSEGQKLEGKYVFVGRMLYAVQIGYEKSTARHVLSDRFLSSFSLK